MISNIFLISGKVKFVIVKKNKNQTKLSAAVFPYPEMSKNMVLQDSLWKYF